MLVSGLFLLILVGITDGLKFDIERAFKKKFGDDSRIDPACSPMVYQEDTCEVNKTSSADLSRLVYLKRRRRNALRCRNWLWPNGFIPVYIRLNNPTILPKLEEALLEFNSVTPCLQFVQVPKEMLPYYSRALEISESQPFPGSRCRASVGTTVANPYMKLSVVCTKGAILHELMHVIGFSHEHARPDRDRYVEIRCENIYRNVTVDFRKVKRSVVDSFGEPYDFASLMHYSFDHFSINGRPTIVPLVPVPDGIDVGNANTFSPSDIRRIKKLYKCKK